MLRMGRGFKTESPDKEKQPEATYQQPAPPREPQPPAPPQEPRATSTSATPVAAATNTSRAVTESEALARDLKDGVLNGFVGGTTVLSGEADFKGMLRIDGRFTGRITSEKGTLIVSAGGVVEANVAVATAKINGTVNGDITATERIEFGRTAQVRGNINTPSLVIENGAVFEGSCRMRQTEPKPAAVTTELRPPQQQQQPQTSRPKSPERTDRAPLADKPKPATAPAEMAEAVK